jgi:hypothetical protein
MKARGKRSTAKLKGASITPLVRPAAPGIVRLARVAEARRRIESGWYDRADVRTRLVEAVLEEIRQD